MSYQPHYLELILTFTTWFMPLCIIVGCSIFVKKILRQKERKRRSSSFTVTNATSFFFVEAKSVGPEVQETVFKRRLKLGAQQKLSLMMTIYLVQWVSEPKNHVVMVTRDSNISFFLKVPSCFLWMINSLCGCIPSEVSTPTYWLTFSVAFSDPVLVLLLNPNYNKRSR